KVHAVRLASMASTICGLLHAPGAASAAGVEASPVGSVTPPSTSELPPVAEPPPVDEAPPAPPLGEEAPAAPPALADVPTPVSGDDAAPSVWLDAPQPSSAPPKIRIVARPMLLLRAVVSSALAHRRSAHLGEQALDALHQ